MRLGGLSSGLGLSLEVLEGEIADETTNGDNTVDAEAAASGGGAIVGRVGVGVGFGDRVTGLESKRLVGDFFFFTCVANRSSIGWRIPGASDRQRAAAPESRGPRRCGRHPRKPRWHPGRRHRAEPPRHHWRWKNTKSAIGYSPRFASLFHLLSEGTKKKRRGIAVNALAGKAGRTYGCSSMNLLQL